MVIKMCHGIYDVYKFYLSNICEMYFLVFAYLQYGFQVVSYQMSNRHLENAFKMVMI